MFDFSLTFASISKTLLFNLEIEKLVKNKCDKILSNRNKTKTNNTKRYHIAIQ